MDEPERFDIPTAGRSSLEMFGAMRAYFEKVAAAKGKKLHPSWYDDGPEKMPWLHKSRGEESRGD